MTLQPLSSRNTSNLNFTSLMKNDRYGLFKVISSHLKSQDYLNFLLSSKRIYEIDTKLKEFNKDSYYKLLVKISSNGLRDKSIDELSTRFLTFCKDTEAIHKYEDSQKVLIKFKFFLNSLVVCGRFREISSETLGRGFLYCCIYKHAAMAELFINSSWFHDLPIDALKKAFVLSGSDEGEITRVLINSSRFQEISAESLGNLLVTAAHNVYLGTVKAISECSRVNEISEQNYMKALNHVVSSDIKEKEKKFRVGWILVNFPQYKEIGLDPIVEGVGWIDSAYDSMYYFSTYSFET